MKKLLLICALLFAALTFVGAGYVLAAKGTVSAGYAVVPMALTVAARSAYRV